MTVKQYSSSNFKSIGDDIYDIKQSLSDIWNSGPDIYNNYSITDNVSSIKSAIKNSLEQKDENLTQVIEQGVKKQLEETKIEYIYEPWGIKLSYFNDSEKFFDEKLQKIIIKYSDTNFLEIKTVVFKEKEFNNWLVKNFDIQSLSKETINNLVFWSKEENKNNILDKVYIVNIDKNIYYIVYRCDSSSIYCNKLNQVARSFEQIK